MKPVRLLVFDFDGTVTDVEAEGVPFRQGYLEDLALLVGRSVGEVEGLADAAEAVVAGDLERYGWVFQGHVVAPASVDPYLRMMPVSRMVLDECGILLGDYVLRDRLLSGLLYKYNYARTVGQPCFKPEAREVFLALTQPGRGYVPWVVTNSDTTHVAHKIAQLADSPGGGTIAGLVANTVGNAKKYVIDDSFTAIAAELWVPGLASRPVLLRRAHYFGVLDRIRTDLGVGWDEVMVCGDIFELDLALPYALGARVILVANDRTPAYEIAFVEAAERGAVVRDLREIVARVE